MNTECKIRELQKQLDKLQCEVDKQNSCDLGHISGFSGTFTFTFPTHTCLTKWDFIRRVFEKYTQTHRGCETVQYTEDSCSWISGRNRVIRYVVKLTPTTWINSQYKLEEELRCVGYKIYQTSISGCGDNTYIRMLVDPVDYNDPC